jgi:hypothetical protein
VAAAPMFPPCIRACMMPARACACRRQLVPVGDAHGRYVRQVTISEQRFMGSALTLSNMWNDTLQPLPEALCSSTSARAELAL